LARDVEFFNTKMSKLQGSGETGEFLLGLVLAKNVVKPLPAFPEAVDADNGVLVAESESNGALTESPGNPAIGTETPLPEETDGEAAPAEETDGAKAAVPGPDPKDARPEAQLLSTRQSDGALAEVEIGDSTAQQTDGAAGK
jgi:hypothetical protein